MTYTMHYNTESHIIEMQVEGLVNQDTLKEIFTQGVQLSKEKDCFRFLNDFRGAAIELSTMGLYSLPEIFSEISSSAGLQADRFKRALVVTPQYARDAVFAEDVTVNRGQHVKFFQDIEEAKTWLLGK
jgi:hypothetical protein